MDSDDIEVKYSFNYNGKINVTDLRARVFSIRIDNQDIFYFILEFVPIDLDRYASPGGLKGILVVVVNSFFFSMELEN